MKAENTHSRKAGFTLVEMLLVLAIVSILMGLGTFAMTGVMSSLELSTTASEVSSIFTRAKEEALTRNENVQIRIYESNSQTFTDEIDYRMISMGVVNPPDDPNEAPENYPITLLEKRFELPPSMIFMEDAPYSTMISGNSAAQKDILRGTESINGVDTPYRAITFTPDNRADLSTAHDWTLTLVEKASLNETAELPTNFITFQLLPGTGKVNLVQP